MSLETTKELVEICHIDQNKYVLGIGGDNGISACRRDLIMW